MEPWLRTADAELLVHVDVVFHSPTHLNLLCVVRTPKVAGGNTYSWYDYAALCILVLFCQRLQCLLILLLISKLATQSTLLDKWEIDKIWDECCCFCCWGLSACRFYRFYRFYPLLRSFALAPNPSVRRQLSDISCQIGQLSDRKTVSADNCQ